MPDRSLAWLVEIESAVADLNAFIHGMNRDVIGEAASRLPEPVKAEAPDIPWPAIISLRNRIAHGYRTIDHRIVWDITQNDVPALEAAVRRMIAHREGSRT